jgi:hypothetical protein
LGSCPVAGSCLETLLMIRAQQGNGQPDAFQELE